MLSLLAFFLWCVVRKRLAMLFPSPFPPVCLSSSLVFLHVRLWCNTPSPPKIVPCWDAPLAFLWIPLPIVPFFFIAARSVPVVNPGLGWESQSLLTASACIRPRWMERLDTVAYVLGWMEPLGLVGSSPLNPTMGVRTKTRGRQATRPEGGKQMHGGTQGCVWDGCDMPCVDRVGRRTCPLRYGSPARTRARTGSVCWGESHPNPGGWRLARCLLWLPGACWVGSAQLSWAGLG